MLRRPAAPAFALLKIDGRYICADNLRFTCILAIIALHATRVLTMGAPEGSAIELFQFAAVSILKFGTIGFFLISGFLLEKNLHAKSSLDVVRRRIQKVLLPWSAWFVLTSIALSATDFTHHTRAFLTGTPLPSALWKTLSQIFTTTALWFVPNLILSLIVLLIFRRYLQSLLFGAALLLVTFFYSVNIYTRWIEPHHTRSFFGFIFYLWLGHYAAVNLDRFTHLLRMIPARLLWAAALFAVMTEFAEGRLLVRLHSEDPQNTLRISTQVFSVLIFLCFFKFQRRLWPAYFDVSRTTFGMYLSHVVTLGVFTSPVWGLLNRPGTHPVLGSFAMRVTIWVVTSALASILSFMVARTLSHSPRLSWMVGSQRSTATLRQNPPLLPWLAKHEVGIEQLCGGCEPEVAGR